MKKLLFIFIASTLFSCQKEEQKAPAAVPPPTVQPPPPPPPAQISFTGSYTRTSVICSNPSYTGWSVQTLTLNQAGNNITIPASQLNIGIAAPIGAYVSGGNATMSSFILDANHSFSGGTMSLSGNNLSVNYEVKLFYNGGALLSANDYQITYVKN